eukprot:gnl/TRDRNA2_/TRDRNA2_127234_c0_seq2.p1 gnl/TRDRNA2_/TRDRNA2_127234_c0~~gnl/TRDRNA2_/TRDRNA2_127234_c0_seq2.p1  ORF type:complete len:588 (-),score=134.52 gnl/TRDRNA2_/TRDRNA2_127234_c0_seq2:101-1813(-)
MVDYEGTGELSSDGFVMLMAIFRATEGFNRAEITHFRHVFGHFAHPTSHGTTEMSPSRLGDALKYVFGPQSADLASRVEAKLHVQVEHAMFSETLTFQEFLGWARRLREAEIEEYRKEFALFDADGSGTIDAPELPAMMKHLGYTPLASTISELLHRVDEDGNGELDFDEFVNLMAVYRETDGFTQDQVEEMRQAFNAFDYDKSGEIDALELKDLLRYLGYTVNLEYARQQISKLKADLTESNELDFREFLRMMRLHREDELSRIHKCFYAHTGGEHWLPSSKVRTVLKALGPLPNTKEIRSELQAATAVVQHDFDSFVDVVDGVRHAHISTMRKHCGFTEAEIEFFRQTFKQYDKNGNGEIDQQEIIAFLKDNHWQLNTAEEQVSMLLLIKKAKSLSHEANLEDSPSSVDAPSAIMSFWQFVQLLRLLQDTNERKEQERNQTALANAGFNLQEVDEFRKVFNHWSSKMESKDAALEPQKKSKSSNWHSRRSIDAALHVPSRLSLDGVRSILHALGVQTRKSEREELQNHFMQLDLDDHKRIDFPDFLRLMRWMLDSNFARINSRDMKTL